MGTSWSCNGQHNKKKYIEMKTNEWKLDARCYPYEMANALDAITSSSYSINYANVFFTSHHQLVDYAQ